MLFLHVKHETFELSLLTKRVRVVFIFVVLILFFHYYVHQLLIYAHIIMIWSMNTATDATPRSLFLHSRVYTW